MPQRWNKPRWSYQASHVCLKQEDLVDHRKKSKTIQMRTLLKTGEMLKTDKIREKHLTDVLKTRDVKMLKFLGGLTLLVCFVSWGVHPAKQCLTFDCSTSPVQALFVRSYMQMIVNVLHFPVSRFSSFGGGGGQSSHFPSFKHSWKKLFVKIVKFNISKTWASSFFLGGGGIGPPQSIFNVFLHFQKFKQFWQAIS